MSGQVLFNTATDIKQLEISEEEKGGYSVNLLANNTQSVVSSVEVDSFENLVIQVEYPGVRGFVVVQNKSLSDLMKDMRYQMLNPINVDEKAARDSEKKLKAVIQVNIHSPELSTYSVARDIANNNNLGIPISQIEVTKNYTWVSNEKVIIGSMYSDKITIDFGDNSNVASSDEEGYKCSYYQNIIVEGGNRYIIKLPEFNHTLERGILKSSMFNLNLEIRGEAEHPFYNIVDLGEFGAIDVNDINMIKGKRRYFERSDFNDCYNYQISYLTEDSLEIKNVTVSNDEGIKWSLSVGLVDYFRSSKHQFIALEMNGKFYIINNKDLKLEHVESDPNSFKRYQPDERGLQIYNNQPINNDDTIIINLGDKSILDFDMEVVGSLTLSSRNNTIVQVENWSTYQPARKMMFVFYEIILSNAKCMKFDCNPEDIVEEFEKEKAKLVNKKGADVNAENSRGNAPLEADNLIMGIFPEERRNEESTRRHKRHHIRHEHHHKGHRNSPIQEVTSEKYSENIASSATRVSNPINNIFNLAENFIGGLFSRAASNNQALAHNTTPSLNLESKTKNNQATSGASKPSSWINGLFKWVKDSVGGLLGSKVALPGKPENSTVQSLLSISQYNENETAKGISPSGFLSVENVALIGCIADALDNTPSKRYQTSKSQGVDSVPTIQFAVNWACGKFGSFVEDKIRSLDSKEKARIRAEVKNAYPEITESFRRGVEFSGNVGLDDVLEKCKKCFCTNILTSNVSQSESQMLGKTDDKPRTCLNDPTVDNQLQRSL